MSSLHVQPASGADPGAILSLLAGAMGRTDDPRFGALLEWKHGANPFGPSPAWVAVEDGEVVGYRAFMRWEFSDGNRTWRAGRAVDTATHPDHQGKGIFRALTMHGLDELRAEGVDFIFNTPNDNSRPGYLRMGWGLVGTLRPAVRPRSPTTLPAVLRGRVPAGHWGLPCEAGLPAAAAFAEDTEVEALLDAAEPEDRRTRLRTNRTPAYLRWRYDGGLLGYRVLLAGDRLEDGAACFRLRQRGPAVEATIGDLLVPGDDPRARRRLIGQVLKATRADYALTLGGRPSDATVGVPGQGPTLVWRSVCTEQQPTLDRWALTMGDIELF
jgi:GNAT superfamily N-acetyltransferase